MHLVGCACGGAIKIDLGLTACGLTNHKRRRLDFLPGIPGKTNGPMDAYKLTIGGGFAGQRVNGGGHNRPASYGGAGCGVGFGGAGLT